MCSVSVYCRYVAFMFLNNPKNKVRCYTSIMTPGNLMSFSSELWGHCFSKGIHPSCLLTVLLLLYFLLFKPYGLVEWIVLAEDLIVFHLHPIYSQKSLPAKVKDVHSSCPAFHVPDFTFHIKKIIGMGNSYFVWKQIIIPEGILQFCHSFSIKCQPMSKILTAGSFAVNNESKSYICPPLTSSPPV